MSVSRRSTTVGLGLLVVLLLSTTTAPWIARDRSNPEPLGHARETVGPWDPLVGDLAHGVPRFSVTNAQLNPSGCCWGGGSSTPVWLAYDSADSAFWVATTADTVAVVLTSNTYVVNASVPVGSQPFGVAADPTDHEVFVTDTGSNNVSVISDQTLLPLGSIGVGASPMGVAYDPVDGEVFVANQGSDNVSVISATTLSVVATVGVGSRPLGVAYDSATGRVFVAAEGSNLVQAIVPASNVVVGNYTVGDAPYGIAVDDATDDLYVTNSGSGNVSVVNASTGANVVDIAIGGLELSVALAGVAYDANTQQVWVGAGSNYLVVLNTTAEAVAWVYQWDPTGVAYDPVDGIICLTNTANSTFECLSNAVGQSADLVNFQETGLPFGTHWAVDLGAGAASSPTSQISIGVCNGPSPSCSGAISYAIEPVDGYTPAPSYGSTASLTGVLNITVLFSPSTTYPVTFNETGLAPGLGWSVSLGGTTEVSSGSSLTFYENNGTYAFTTGPVTNYVVLPESGSLTVSGAPITTGLVFKIIAWNISFVESGLPPGVAWYVNFSSGPPGFTLPSPAPITQPTQVFVLADGSYAFGVQTPDPSFLPPPNGSVSIHGGPSSVSIVFAPVRYAVTFTETGLPLGTRWAATLAGGVENSTSAQISFLEANGDYPFTIGDVSGYHAAPLSGVVTVDTAPPPPVSVTFSSTSVFSVTFHETGLPLGRGWSVAIGGQFESSLTDNISLLESNGTYGYVVQAVPGYSATYSGLVTVDGADWVVPIGFAPATFPVIVIEFGLPNGTNWSATVTNDAAGFNETLSANGTAIIFFLPNGTYTISVRVPSGFTASLLASTFTVTGYTLPAPSVRFTGVGPPRGGDSYGVGPVPSYYWWALGAMGGALIALAALLVLRWSHPPRSPGTPIAPART